MPLMPIEQLPDWEMRLARQDAFWANAILDRPVVIGHLGKTNPDFPWPAPKAWTSVRDRWMDAGYVAERAVAGVMNTDYLGDALPCAHPNLGPEVFSAFFGCELEYGDTTSWSIPNLEDWAEVATLRFSDDNVYWRKIDELTDALLAAGQGRFYTGITDLHPGADALVAFRDPLRMNLDLVEAPDAVKALLETVTQVYFQVYDHYAEKLTAAGQAICSWPGIVSSKRWYVPSNDFSCMISKAMFDEFFLPGIIAECRHMEANIYHLDGPNALQHLDSLLEIPELNAIQWVYGAGHGRASDWLPVYQRCQAAGKGLQLTLEPDELPLFMETLKPEGLWIGLAGIQSREHFDTLVARISRWKG
jgi:hypothetical protein